MATLSLSHRGKKNTIPNDTKYSTNSIYLHFSDSDCFIVFIYSFITNYLFKLGSTNSLCGWLIYLKTHLICRFLLLLCIYLVEFVFNIVYFYIQWHYQCPFSFIGDIIKFYLTMDSNSLLLCPDILSISFLSRVDYSSRLQVILEEYLCILFCFWI